MNEFMQWQKRLDDIHRDVMRRFLLRQLWWYHCVLVQADAQRLLPWNGKLERVEPADGAWGVTACKQWLVRQDELGTNPT